MEKTFSELIQQRGSKYQAKKLIYKRSRSLYLQSDKPKYCVQCGCTTCFEVDHIKPICQFPLDTPIAEIYHIDNLQALCPTCHAVKTRADSNYISY